MAKIMLVEDDNNLREIYGARLLAEGHEIVSAKDGEEALALAVQEKPELIISDVMMPRISGFDMLDILRNAPETKNTKVIMMTALSQAEDKARADKLGADRYLVKSQVTLEDVANVVHEVLEGDIPEEPAPPVAVPAPPVAAPAQVAVTPAPADTSAATAIPTPQPVVSPQSAVDPVPGPTMPEVQEVPVDTQATPQPQTVEAIANPVVEVDDDTDPAQVQAPPLAEDSLAASSPDVAPQPIHVTVASTSTTSDDDDTAQAAVPAPQPVTDNLPPIVEPAQQPQSIKVEMPQPLDAPATPPAQDSTVTVPEPVAPVVQPEPDFVGPSLTQALASEDAQSEPGQSASSEPIAAPEVPTVVNGAPVQEIVKPTKPIVGMAAQPEPAAAPVSANTNGADFNGKKVIVPINDPLAQPDINQLLAAEERNAAVANPVANTVITPETPPQQPAKTSEFDNIAL